jgi:hypothetical protein
LKLHAASLFQLHKYFKITVKVGHSRIFLLLSRSKHVTSKRIWSFQRFRRTRTYSEELIIDTEALPNSQFLFTKVFLDHSLHIQIYVGFAMSSLATNLLLSWCNLVSWITMYLTIWPTYLFKFNTFNEYSLFTKFFALKVSFQVVQPQLHPIYCINYFQHCWKGQDLLVIH